MKHLGDITQIKGSCAPLVDIVTGGSPCQDLSIAGQRKGLAGERSGLFMEQIRIIKEMRSECERRLHDAGADYNRTDVKPRYMVWENVAGAFSSNKGEDFRAVLEETSKVADKDAYVPGLEGGKWSPCGCILGNGWSIAWRLHDSQWFGVPQRRKRICLLADFNGDTAGKVLFELQRETTNRDTEQAIVDIGTESRSEVQSVSKGLSGDIAQSGKEGESVTEDTERCTGEASYTLKIRGGADTYRKPDGNTVEQHAVCIENHPADSRVKIVENGICQTLSGRMGTGGGNVPMVMESQEPVVLYNNQNNAGISQNGICNTLPTSAGMGGGYVPMVVESINGEISGTLDASYYKGCGERQGVEREVVCVGNGQLAQARLSPTVGTLNCMHDQQAVMTMQDRTETVDACIGKGTTSVVRRLTPMECERLQGFPDDWTRIGDWVDSKGKTHKVESDAPRYKALGNSIALPFWEWMAERMVKQLKADGVEHPTMASLFDGIGGFPLVYSRCGCEPIWASEIEEFPIAVTKIRFPEEEG